MAALSPPQTRSYSLVAFVDITFDDLVGTTVVNLFAVPVGSVFITMSMNVTTTFVASGTTDCEIGDATDPNEYSTTTIELDGSVGLPTNNCTVTTRFLTTSSEPNLVFTPASGSGDPTAGAAYLYAEYINDAVFHENYQA